MIEVNEAFVGALLGVFSGSEPDLSEEFLLSIDPEDKDLVDQLLVDQIKPFYGDFTESSQRKIKESLRWLLNVGDTPQESPAGDKIGTLFEQVFYSNLIALKLPKNPKFFYLHLWKVLFGDEDYRIPELNRYVRNDTNEFVNNLV